MIHVIAFLASEAKYRIIRRGIAIFAGAKLADDYRLEHLWKDRR